MTDTSLLAPGDEPGWVVEVALRPISSDDEPEWWVHTYGSHFACRATARYLRPHYTRAGKMVRIRRDVPEGAA